MPNSPAGIYPRKLAITIPAKHQESVAETVGRKTACKRKPLASRLDRIFPQYADAFASACRRRGERRPERGAFQKLLRHFWRLAERGSEWRCGDSPSSLRDRRHAKRSPRSCSYRPPEDGGADARLRPVAMDECRRRLGDAVEYASDMYNDAAGRGCPPLSDGNGKQFRAYRRCRCFKRTSVRRTPLHNDGRKHLGDPGIL